MLLKRGKKEDSLGRKKRVRCIFFMVKNTSSSGYFIYSHYLKPLKLVVKYCQNGLVSFWTVFNVKKKSMLIGNLQLFNVCPSF